MATTIKKKGAPEFDWRTIKTDWLAKNLRAGQKPFTLKQVAKKWGVAYPLNLGRDLGRGLRS